VSDLAVHAADGAEAEGEPRAKDRGTIVQRRARLALATMLALLVALAAVAAFATDRLYSSAQDRYIKEAFPLRAYARDLLVQMLNKETAVRGYMITANPGSLQPYTTALPAARSDLAGLRRLTRRRPEIAHQVQNAAELVRSLDSYFQTQIALVRSGH
jgi:CHASE3 domain sensor protein